MRTVTVNHRDSRGKTEYRIYETTDLLLAEQPDAIIKNRLADAKNGDYVVSANGWVVPLISISFIEDKQTRGSKRYLRKKVYRYAVFHFPKDRKVFRLDKLHLAVFNYNPWKSSSIASEQKRNRMFELSPRKIAWANLVIEGHSFEQAVREVYPSKKQYNAFLKTLLLNDKLMDYVNEKRGLKMEQRFEHAGWSFEEFVSKAKAIVEDKNENPQLRLWAMRFVGDLLSNKGINTRQKNSQA